MKWTHCRHSAMQCRPIDFSDCLAPDGCTAQQGVPPAAAGGGLRLSALAVYPVLFN